MFRRRFVALFALLAACWTLVPAGTARAGFTASAGQLAFRSLRDGNSQVYVAPTDGTGVLTNLSKSSSQEMDPA